MEKNLTNEKKILLSLITFGFILLVIVWGAIIQHYRKAAYTNGKLEQSAERTYSDAADTNRELERTNQELSDIIKEVRKQKSD